MVMITSNTTCQQLQGICINKWWNNSVIYGIEAHKNTQNMQNSLAEQEFYSDPTPDFEAEYVILLSAISKEFKPTIKKTISI